MGVRGICLLISLVFEAKYIYKSTLHPVSNKDMAGIRYLSLDELELGGPFPFFNVR